MFGQYDWLFQDYLQDWMCEVFGKVFFVDYDFVGVWFDLYVGNSVFLFVGGVGMVLGVQFLDMDWCFRGCGFDCVIQFFQGLQFSYC